VSVWTQVFAQYVQVRPPGRQVSMCITSEDLTVCCEYCCVVGAQRDAGEKMAILCALSRDSKAFYEVCNFENRYIKSGTCII
jgi:hypothetical protein